MKVILFLFFGAVKSEECKQNYDKHFQREIIENGPNCVCIEGYTSYNFLPYVSFHPFCCPPNSTAVITDEDKPECTCNPGFNIDRHGVDDFHRSIVCVDKDECAELNACPEYQMCVNTVGSYICECEYGFLDASGDCRNESAVTTAATGVAYDLLTTEAAESTDCLMQNSSECVQEGAVTTGATVVADDFLTTVAAESTDCLTPDSGECGHESAVTTESTVVVDDLLTTIATISTDCIPGQYRDEESQLCVPCNRGHYCIFEQQTPCPKGFFSNSPGSSACESCGAGMTTAAEGGISPRNCVTHPFGFTAFGYKDPAACEFQNFCPKGMKELDAFYGNHKGLPTCLGSEPVATKQEKISMKEHAIPAYYERTSNVFCFNLCRRKEACLAFSVSMKKAMNCVLVYGQ